MDGEANLDRRLTAVGADGYVSADDVIFLRGEIFPDGIRARDELRSIFALGERAPDGDPEWPEFFAEACADFFLNEEKPSGYVTNGDFAALKALVTRDGRNASPLELKTLVRLLEKAVAAPNEMTDFVADQIRAQFATSAGRAIGASDASLIRTFLYASGGSGTIGITREEAELLFDLHDATAGLENSDEWRELFVKAIAAHLMQYIGYRPVAREEALRLNAWTTDHSVRPGRFLRAMFDGGFSAIASSYRRERRWSDKNGEDEIGAEIAQMVTAREADWLADRIARNGIVDDAEKALLAYMSTLGADLPPKLASMVEEVSPAATG
ncbi:MAG: hypothetical protein GC152_00425 [Alphaproteobacteria bacterium]|nr:hypothetical protein [Alphaproteobacteria bacterium]